MVVFLSRGVNHAHGAVIVIAYICVIIFALVTDRLSDQQRAAITKTSDGTEKDTERARKDAERAR